MTGISQILESNNDVAMTAQALQAFERFIRISSSPPSLSYPAVPYHLPVFSVPPREAVVLASEVRCVLVTLVLDLRSKISGGSFASYDDFLLPQIQIGLPASHKFSSVLPTLLGFYKITLVV